MTPSTELMLSPAPRQSHGVVIAGISFLLGVLCASAWFVETDLRAAQNTVNATPNTSSTTNSGFEEHVSSGLLTVHDQDAGNAAVVDTVSVPAPGVWVAIVELHGNDLGNILGVAGTAGSESNVAVHLLRNTLPGQTYAVVLYRDDGDGVFDLHADSVYVDYDSGQRVIALFHTNP